MVFNYYIFRLPYLQEGNDLVNFQIAEDTTVGSIVYTLKGIDPEGVKVTYTISGDHFSVTRETGVITLRAPLDREVEELIEVVVTVQVFLFSSSKIQENTLFLFILINGFYFFFYRMPSTLLHFEDKSES